MCWLFVVSLLVVPWLIVGCFLVACSLLLARGWFVAVLCCPALSLVVVTCCFCWCVLLFVADIGCLLVFVVNVLFVVCCLLFVAVCLLFVVR